MKTLEFKTSKGSFILSDENYYLVNERGVKTAYLNNVKQFEYVSFIRLSEITEEQASEIVDYDIEKQEYQGGGIYDTIYDYNKGEYVLGNSQIDSLYTFFESEDIILFNNPIDLDENLECKCDICILNHENLYDTYDNITFYNPVILKLC